MKRDMDLIREILLFLEANNEFNEEKRVNPNDFSNDNVGILSSHFRLIKDAKYIQDLTIGSGGYIVTGAITNQGYDFIESVRNPDIWRKTKAAGDKVGGWTVSLLAEYAKGLLKLQFDNLLNGGAS